jgi:hypothetical protein
VFTPSQVLPIVGDIRDETSVTAAVAPQSCEETVPRTRSGMRGPGVAGPG